MLMYRRVGFAATTMYLTMLLAGGCALEQTDKEGTMDLRIGEGKQWAFLGGDWTDGNGIIRPPNVRNLHSRAFCLDKAYDDVTAEFEYNPSYREQGSGDAGLILRASDGGHFYLVSFPWVGQQTRAKHFWASVAKVSGDGYLRYIDLVWVPNVVSENERWYKVKVEAKGNRITAWVDGRYALSVTDDTYKSGFVGLAGYGWYAFRNVRIAGREVTAPKWDDTCQIP